MTSLQVVVAYLIVQRLAEVVIDRRNAKVLLAAGGIEFGPKQYPLMVCLHVTWLLALLVCDAIAPRPLRHEPLLALFVLLQFARVWVMIALGRLWTIRVVLLPGAKRVRHGPYRLVKHPAYVVVSLELAVVPLMFGLWYVALGTTILNRLLLSRRIKTEEDALAAIYGD